MPISDLPAIMYIRRRGPDREHKSSLAELPIEDIVRNERALPLGHQRVVQHAGAADFFGAEPEFFADELFAFGEDELEGLAIAAEVDDLAGLAATIGREKDAAEA